MKLYFDAVCFFSLLQRSVSIKLIHSFQFFHFKNRKKPKGILFMIFIQFRFHFNTPCVILKNPILTIDFSYPILVLFIGLTPKKRHRITCHQPNHGIKIQMLCHWSLTKWNMTRKKKDFFRRLVKTQFHIYIQHNSKTKVHKKKGVDNWTMAKLKRTDNPFQFDRFLWTLNGFEFQYIFIVVSLCLFGVYSNN